MSAADPLAQILNKIKCTFTKEKIRFIVDNNECSLVVVSVTLVRLTTTCYHDLMCCHSAHGWLSTTANKLNCSKQFWQYNLATIQLIFAIKQGLTHYAASSCT
jgi:hypothetical protein